MGTITALMFLTVSLFSKEPLKVEKATNTNMIDYVIKHMNDNNQVVFNGEDELNIVYIEGMGLDLKPNDNKFNEWNDLRLVFKYVDECPEVLFMQLCTTEPGRLATFQKDSVLRKGVARIKLGQYTVWKMGYHNVRKNRKTHPALVQHLPLPVCRDLNRDGKRNGDYIDFGIFGINQHGTRIGYKDGKVENWSEGCLVGKDWNKHLEFIELLKTDKRYKNNNEFIFTTTIISSDEINFDSSLVFN